MSDRSQKIGKFIEIEEKIVKKLKKLDIFWPFFTSGGPNRSLHWIYWPLQEAASIKLALDVLKCVQQGLHRNKLLEIWQQEFVASVRSARQS